jgi:uncharacterized protein (DUF1330 family)
LSTPGALFAHSLSNCDATLVILLREIQMITCHVRYVIDPSLIEQFEAYAKMWTPLVEKFGGRHHGYFLPAEGANNIALALFSFSSLAAYEKYRQESQNDAECQKAFAYAAETRCVLSYERSFFRPVLG